MKQNRMKSMICKKGILLFLFFITYFIYLYWRLVYTIPTTYGIISLIAGALLFIAELAGFFESVVFYYTLWDTGTVDTPVIHARDYPDVDILITTYNEPKELLYKTIVGCLNMDYPDRSKVHIYLCDDGSRKEMKELCDHLSVHYIERKEHLHAKAGNLNHALTLTASPLVVTFDADMIPMHDFLLVTVPYFVKDEKMGFVQVPQNFYNADLFQYNLFTERNMPNEQDLFSRSIQAGKSKHNAVIYAGSNTVLRRQALEDIGGLVTDTITEDFATGMKIQSRGYHSTYVNEVHASGLAPESLEDLYRQRIRWGRGVIQTFQAFHPFRMRGLNLKQKILYLSTASYWYFGIWRLIFFLAPILFAVFGVIVLDARALTMLLIWFPMFLFTNLTFRYFTNHVRTVSWSHIYDTILFPQILGGVLKETFGMKMSQFHVTPKETVTRTGYVQRFELVWIQIVLALLTLAGLVRITYLFFTSGYQVQYVINFFWLAYNSYIFLMAIFFATERPKLRNGERIAAKTAVLIRQWGCWYEGRSTDLSEQGITLVTKDAIYFHPDQAYPLKIETGRSITEMKVRLVRTDSVREGYKYIFTIDEIEEKHWQQYLMVLYDRIPVFPSVQQKQHMVGNLLHIIRSRRNKFSPYNRKYPRIFMGRMVNIEVNGIESSIRIEDFNYEYITSKYRVLGGTFQWQFDLDQEHVLTCELDQKLTDNTRRKLFFYRILNYHEGLGKIV